MISARATSRTDGDLMEEYEYLDRAFRYALSLAGSRADAEDLVQEAWLRLHEKYGRVSDIAVAFRTIRNLHIDRHRRRKFSVLTRPEELPEDAAPTPPVSIPRDVPIGALGDALQTLREEEREALFLFVVEEYTAQEISDLTGRPRGTVLSIVHRAKHKLADRIAARSHEDHEGNTRV